MSYLIDGNNLIGRTPGIDLQSPDARRRLLRRLAAFRNLPGRRPRRFTVVFDGEPEFNFPEGSMFQGVQILYSQPGSTADARIKQRVKQQRDKAALTVVTSDRDLSGYVRACGIQVLTCEQFNRRLQAALESAGVGEKTDHEPGVNEIDEWLRYFGIEEE